MCKFLVFLPVFLGLITGFLTGKLLQRIHTQAALITVMLLASAGVGASFIHAPKSVIKYLGFTLLPHSGVSLVFTGIAVSVLSASAPECASIIQGTIAAAAVINEIIAVFMAKKGFEWVGELNKAEGETV